MAMKALRCPQCAAQLELDDSKEFGFCSYCGTKVQLNEKITVEHTGSVKMDNSDQGYNRIRLGDRAFEAQNFEEAYHCYTQALEDIPDDVRALSRKGICAVLLSPADNLRTSELIAGCSAAREIINKKAQSAGGDVADLAAVQALKAQFDKDLDVLARQLLANKPEYIYKCLSQDVAAAQAAQWSELARLFQAVCDLVYGETVLEPLLTLCIETCDTWLEMDRKRKISYYVNSTTNSSGKSTDHYNSYKMPEPRRTVIEAARQKMADRFNALPSRLEKAKGLTAALDALQLESDNLKKSMNAAQDKYEAAKSAFWRDNPHYAERRKKAKWLTWIAVGVGLLALLVCLIIYFFFNKSTYILVIGIAALVVSFLLRMLLAKMIHSKMEKDLFPADVKALGDAFAAARDQWASKESERKNKQIELKTFKRTDK